MNAKYRLKSPTMAVERRGADCRMSIVTIGTGTVVEVIGTVQETGLVDVRCEGRILAVFMRDLEERGRQMLTETYAEHRPVRRR